MSAPEAGRATHTNPAGGKTTVNYVNAKSGGGRYGMMAAAVGALALAGYFFYGKKRAENHPIKTQAERLKAEVKKQL